MPEESSPAFRGGPNIAMKIPPHEFQSTVAFYRDTIGLPLVEEEVENAVFRFGGMRLWLDESPELSQAEIWLEIQTDNVALAADYLDKKGVIRRDEIEKLPDGFEGFWICNPGGIIHLVSRT